MNMPVHAALVLASSRDRGWRGLEAELCRLAPGKTSAPGEARHRVGLHFGPAVRALCRLDGRVQRRIQAEGDADIVPAGVGGEWEDDRPCTVLRLRFEPAFLRTVLADIVPDAERFELAPRLQLRDARLEHIGRAIKAEIEADAASDPLYAESLGVALAVRLVATSTCVQAMRAGGLSSRQRVRLLDYIESRLGGSLSLLELAGAAGLGLSHLKAQFRISMGMPVHQYVMRRRVERARMLLLAGQLPLSQIALESGFSHQSHMASCMRRILGVTPRQVRRPNLL